MKSIFLLAVLLLGFATVYSQTFVSPQQETTLGGFSDTIGTLNLREVVIDGEEYSYELPEGGFVSGTLELIQEIKLETEKRTIYELGTGGLLSVIDDEDDTYDHVFLNLLGTEQKMTITYWLVKADRGDD